MKMYEFIPFNIEIHSRWWVILAVCGLPFLEVKPNHQINHMKVWLKERTEKKTNDEQQQMEKGRQSPKNILS